MDDFDSPAACTFGLEVDGHQIKEIQEISGLKMEQDVIELKQNTADGKYVIKKLPGREKAGEATISRALKGDNTLDQWIKDSRLGKMASARTGVAIKIYDHEGNPLKGYKLENAWAKSWEIVSLKAGDTSVLTEKLVITYEKMEPE